jgi:hypothetical protein
MLWPRVFVATTDLGCFKERLLRADGFVVLLSCLKLAVVLLQGLAVVALMTVEHLIEETVILRVEMILKKVTEPRDWEFITSRVTARELIQFFIHHNVPSCCFLLMNEVSDEQRLSIKVKADFPAQARGFEVGLTDSFAVTIRFVFGHRKLSVAGNRKFKTFPSQAKFLIPYNFPSTPGREPQGI